MPVIDLNEAPVEVGDFLTVRLQYRQDDGVWLVAWDDAPPGWKIMASERDASEWQPGTNLRLRVFRLDPAWRKVWLTQSGFGFLKVSERMRPRYLHAVRVVVPFLETGGRGRDFSELLDNLSESKGVVNRCVRQDQYDWFDVWCGLGRPDREELRNIAWALMRLRQGLKDGDLDFSERMRRTLLQKGFPSMLLALRKHLEAVT